MQKIDQAAMRNYSIPEIILMENAGLQTTLAIMETFPDIDQKSVLIVSGPGNNGGDGFVIARHLSNLGSSVNVAITQSAVKYKGVSGENLEILKKMNVPVLEITTEGSIYELLNIAAFSDVIVDAIFGTGLSKHIEGHYLALINGLNSVPAPKISVDIPSGIDGSTGLVMGAAIKAMCTVTFAAPKIGHVLDPGSHYIGKFYIADISIPKVLLNSPDFKVNLTTENFVRTKLPARPGSSNKSTFGKALLIGGSKLYSGAPKIARNALLRSGAGVSFVMVPDSILSETQSDNTDAIIIGLKSSKDGYIKASLENIESVLEFININKITAVGLGMGMTDTEDTAAFVGELLSKIEVPVCLDADGLSGLKKYKEKILANRGLKLVITPHAGEMAKLIGSSSESVLMDRLNISRDFSSENNCVTLLKGHRTIICDQEGKTYINTSGNPAMAKGGMGDALTGLITGFLTLGMKPMDAAVCGCYIHGKAGDLALAKVFEYCMTTNDLIGKISEAMAAVAGTTKR